MLFESEELDLLHRNMNSEGNVPPKGFRRNVAIYPLVCYVNNIICCYLSKNLEPIHLFIERSKNHIQDNPPTEEWGAYYQRVENYIELLEEHLRANGVESGAV